MATVASLLRQIDLIEKSKHLNALQKSALVAQIKVQIDEAAGQLALPLAQSPAPVDPSAGPSYAEGTVRVPKAR